MTDNAALLLFCWAKQYTKMKALLLTTVCAVAAAVAQGAEDILVADFERADYGDWKVEGEAFGPGPARGTLRGQMPVSGFKGERLVNSFFNGDRTVGTLTSPPFKLERDYLAFLIGGGGIEGKTCMNLLIDGAVVRTAEGPNTEPGGSEQLESAAWDVRAWKGRTAVLQIVDQATGGWGHINVDHIVQTDARPALLETAAREKSFTIEHRHLVIPIKNGAKKTELIVEVDGQPVRRYSTELATKAEDVDWFAYLTIEEHRGRTARVRATRATEQGFALVRPADEVPGSEHWYKEKLRPQFHFSQDVGWNNDPNGMVYLDGEWHLFFQHNPVGWKWGNMTWGHAVSRDLVHWEQLPDKFFPKTTLRGDAFSGGATVDTKNTAGWKKGQQDVLVAFLTDTGAGESVAYSNDKGRTFTLFEGNPVVKHRGRDPKVIWYAYDRSATPLNDTARKLGGHWVMAVYNEDEPRKQNITFHTSTDLKQWQEQSFIKGYFECPEFFELAIDGDKKRTRWVLLGADARYALGSFDGKRFTPEHEGKHRVHWGKYYASQTFDNAPRDRRIQIGWAQIDMPGMPFNQAFSFPHELSLRTTEDGTRLFAKPVKEIEKLHRKKHTVRDREFGMRSRISVPVVGDIFDVRATFEVGRAEKVILDIGGNAIVYDVAKGQLGEAPLKPVNGRVSVQVLVDRPMLEICGNDGRVFITLPRQQHGEAGTVNLSVAGGPAKLVSLEVFELESIWKKQRERAAH